MIQDIFPYQFNNRYKCQEPCEDDYVLCYHDREIYLKEDGSFITVKEAGDRDYYYGVSIDDKNFFLCSELEGFPRFPLFKLRHYEPRFLGFSGAVGAHIDSFVRRHQYCGKCGAKMVKSVRERAMECPSCKQIYYPQISPAVIVAIIHEDKILCTKYAAGHSGYARYALVAGYAEVGETIEETVKREVKEEVGLEVKDITFYKSQPWPFSNSLLFGFSCHVDGSNEIILDEEELSEAVWIKREDLGDDWSDASLTHEMILKFKEGIIR